METTFSLIYNFLQDVFFSLINVSRDVISFLSTTVEINGTDYTLIGLMFGSFIPVLLGFLVLKAVIS